MSVGLKKKQVMDVLYKYKEAFILRDEIGTCPNIEAEIDVTDKFSFFVRPYHVKEEDKNILHKEMKRLFLFRHIKGKFFQHI